MRDRFIPYWTGIAVASSQVFIHMWPERWWSLWPVMLVVGLIIDTVRIKEFGDLVWERWYRWPSRLIPINIAARATYDAVRDNAIEGVARSGDSLVAARMTCIVIHAAMQDIQLYGVESPSTIFKPIPSVWCEPENIECRDGSDNVSLGQSENGNGYSKIAITASNLKRHIAWVRNGMKDIESNCVPKLGWLLGQHGRITVA